MDRKGKSKGQIDRRKEGRKEGRRNEGIRNKGRRKGM